MRSAGEAGLTKLLNLGMRGDVAARDQAFAIVYAELKRAAAAQLRSNRANETLSPTALVNEAYLKLISGAQLALNDRAHFFALSARAMRQLLIDRQRLHKCEKHGGALVRVELNEESAGAMSPDAGVSTSLRASQPPMDYLDLDRALTELHRVDARAAQVVELHFFAGLNFMEIAELLALCDKTVRRDWNSARAFLLLHASL